MNRPVIHPVESPEQIDAVRKLFRAYGDYLAATASICIENLTDEIASLPSPYTLLLLATVNEQPAGCAALKRLTREGEAACELKRLWVSPSFRGQALGKLLMQTAIDYAKHLEFTTLYLDTVPAAMPHANRLYEALGFASVGRYNANTVANVAFFRLALHDRSLNTDGPGESV